MNKEKWINFKKPMFIGYDFKIVAYKKSKNIRL